jgi:UDP-N-acetylmuramoylalanine--D-glutamate ligase
MTTVASRVALFDGWLASGREVAVVGLGKSGVAASLLLRRLGIGVYASDTGSGPIYDGWAQTLRESGAVVDLGGHDLERIARAAAVVVAPGVPPTVPALDVARRAGLEIYAEVDIGFLALRTTRCVAITGTNGKTTTTALIAHVLSSAGLRAETAGNIGRPLCNVALSPNPPAWLALELSSFQLHDAPHLRPAVGVLTNLAPNHLDRYTSLDEYYGDKAQLFRNADLSSAWVTNADDPAVQEMTRSVPGRQVRFSTQIRADGWYDR